MLRVTSVRKGTTVEAADGSLGSVADVLFDDRSWKIRWLLLDTGAWLPSRKILIHPCALCSLDEADEFLACDLSRAQVRASPSLTTDEPVSAGMEHQICEHYGWSPMWRASMFGGPAIAMPPCPPLHLGSIGRDKSSVMAAETAVRDIGRLGDPHLRSAMAVKDHGILASDGAIGRVEDFLLDDADWEMRYLVVDTMNWWPGQHILVSPFAVREIHPARREVQLDVDREKVKSSPPWDPADAPDHIYERRLHTHYGWPGHRH